MADRAVVGMLVPTMNRAAFVLRQLRYYADVGCHHTVYVGDSSGLEEAARLQDGIARLGDRLRVVYAHLPGVNDYGAISTLARLAREPYVAYIGDDDFFVPASLTRSASFLERNPDYASAHGKAVLLSVDAGREHGEVVGASGIAHPAIEQPSARLRLVEYLSKYWTICFSVHRRDQYAAIVDETAMLADRSFRELFMSCRSVVMGKAAQLDCLFLIRQGHPRRFRLPAACDWIVSPAWHSSYTVFEQRLTEEITRQDGVDLDAATDAVRQAFSEYLVGMVRKSGGVVVGHNGLRATIRRIPAARAAWSLLRSFQPARRDPLSLSELLHRASPYHDDFMMVYRSIVEQPLEPTMAAACATA